MGPVAVDGNGRRESVIVECLRLCENGDDTNYRRGACVCARDIGDDTNCDDDDDTNNNNECKSRELKNTYSDNNSDS